MICLTLTKDRLYDLTLDRAADRPDARAYRFGSAAQKPFHCFARRTVRGAKALLDAALKIITAAKLRRIEREFRIHGPHHDWLRIDDDHFTPVDR